MRKEVSSDLRTATGIQERIRRMEARHRELDSKIDSKTAELSSKIDSKTAELNDKIDALKDSLASAKVWALVLYIALAGSLYATLARGFGWL